MDLFTRRSFVKSVGIAAGLGSVPVIANAEAGQLGPDVPMPKLASDPKALRYRQVHLDFHTSPLITDVGVDFDPSQFVAMLEGAHVNSVNIFAKDHHGMMYYPSKTGPVHPGLKFDLLGEQIAACHKAGILTPVYMTIVWDQYAAEQHADWCVVNEHGATIHNNMDGATVDASPLEAGWRWLCPNTPYLDYVSAQVEEVAKNYEVDGFWFDILLIPPNGCFCHYCMQERETLGLDSSRLEDRAKHSGMVFQRAMDRLESTVRKHRPEVATFFNGQVRIGMRPYLKHYTQIEVESLPGGEWGYGHFAVMSRYVRNLGLDYLGMDARFHRTWGDFGSLRNQAALDFECFRMLAQAGKCSVGDQMHPRGRLLEPVYNLIGTTYKSVEEKEPWCVGARAVAEIGVLSTFKTSQSRAVTDSDAGATNLLTQLQFQFDILDFESDFSRYKVVILPDSHRFTPALRKQAQSFLAGGGKLILSHESGLDVDGKQFAMEEMGLEYAGPSPYSGDKGDYFQALDGVSDGIPAMVQFTYSPSSLAKAQPGTEVLARFWKPYFDRTYAHFSSHRQTPWNHAEEYTVASQRGNIVYISFPVFAAYAQNAYLVHKLLVRNCLRRLLPSPLLRAELPSTAEATVTEQNGNRIVHLLHYPSSRRAPGLDIVEEAVPLSNVKIALLATNRPSRVYLAPQRNSLSYTFNEGYAQTVVPQVNGHQMVVFEA